MHKLVQVNPCTLRLKTKRELYFSQMVKAKVHVFGAQEVRQRWAGVVSGNGYTVAQSSSDEGGHGGCLLAFSDKLQFAAPSLSCPLPVTVASVDVNILNASHRRLICRVEAPRYQSLCCSLHGPDKAHKQPATQAGNVNPYWAVKQAA